MKTAALNAFVMALLLVAPALLEADSPPSASPVAVPAAKPAAPAPAPAAVATAARASAVQPAATPPAAPAVAEAVAQAPTPAAPQPAPAAPVPAAPPSTPGPAGDGSIRVYLGQSHTIQTPWPITRVALTDPKIADVQALTPRQVLVQGKAVGSTDITMWSRDEQVWHVNLRVEVNPELLRANIKQLFPDTTITVSQVDNVVALKGTISHAQQAEQLHQLLQAYGVKYVDMTTLGGLQQVLLKVRIAEVSRTAIRALGFNAVWNGTDFFGGVTIAPQNGTPLVATLTDSNAGTGVNGFNRLVFSPATTVFAGFPDADFFAFLQALSENQYLRILAEPNLIAMSGQDASFLAGGEFPIPIVQGSTAGGGTAITIEYKKFGVQLKFRPTVMGDNTIRLRVAPEVSELSDNGAVIIQGFRIPSLVTRQAETTLELKSQQTFAMAGLISQTTNATTARIPALGDLPILGALFRSVQYTKGETELVVLVTASLIEPTSSTAKPPVPGMLHVEPNDWEFYGLGKIEGSEPPLPCEEAKPVEPKGLNRLRGPGAWAKYESPEEPPPQSCLPCGKR